MQRARPRHGTGHQHLRRTLVTEITIGEAHARYRSTERAVIALVEIEARLERKALDGSANRLAADLQRIAGQAHMADRPRARELDRPGRAEIVEHPACATGTVETGESEHLAGYKLAGFIGIHHSGQRRHNHRPGRDGPQHQTRKHAATPTYRARAPALFEHDLFGKPVSTFPDHAGIFTRCLPYQPWQHWSSLVGKV